MSQHDFSPQILQSPTGANLAVYRSEAKGRRKPKAIIHINHGLAEHAARYARFAEALNKAGFHVIAQDHRGHGATSATDAPPRVFAAQDGMQKVLDDCHFVNAHAREMWPGLPVIILGHSMGGLITLNYVIQYHQTIDAAAVWNANFSAGVLGRLAQTILAWEKFRLGSDVPSRMLPKLTFQDWAKKVPDAKTDFDWLSRDEAEVAKYVADPLCGWDASVSMWQDLFLLIFAGADDANLKKVPRTMPFNLLGGEKDPATEGGKAVLALDKRMGALGFGDVECTVLPETRHESLNEINRDETTERFIQWANRVSG